MSMFSFQAIHNNDQRNSGSLDVVYRLCQCSLFKQFTTDSADPEIFHPLFIDYVNVLFSSNSQHVLVVLVRLVCCLSIMSMFSFQAIHNVLLLATSRLLLFIDYVNVLFSSNSQRTISFYFSMQRYIFFRTVPNIFFKVLKNKHFTF